MPHKNKPTQNIFEDIRHGYTGAQGLLENTTANNVIAAAITRREGLARRSQLRYGKPQNGRHIKVVHYKDENGNSRKRVIVVGSTVECTECDLDSDKTLAAQIVGGEIIDNAEIEARGWTWSGFLQTCKAEYKMLQEIKR